MHDTTIYKTRYIDRFLYELDDIEARARKKYGYCTGLYLQYVIEHFIAYWRHIQLERFDDIHGEQWDSLYLEFNIKLADIAVCRLDMEWIIYEYDNKQLFHEGHSTKPFWPQRKPKRLKRRR